MTSAVSDKSQRWKQNAYIVRDKILRRMGFTFASDKTRTDDATLTADSNIYDLFDGSTAHGRYPDL